MAKKHKQTPDNLTAIIEDLEDDLRNADNLNAQLESDKSLLKEENGRLKSEIKRLQSELAQAHKNYASLRDSF